MLPSLARQPGGAFSPGFLPSRFRRMAGPAHSSAKPVHWAFPRINLSLVAAFCVTVTSSPGFLSGVFFTHRAHDKVLPLDKHANRPRHDPATARPGRDRLRQNGYSPAGNRTFGLDAASASVRKPAKSGRLAHGFILHKASRSGEGWTHSPQEIALTTADPQAFQHGPFRFGFDTLRQ